MACPSHSGLKGPRSDCMLSHSGTTSHMTPLSDRFNSASDCDVLIRLADYSTAKASPTGFRSVHWMTNSGRWKVTLSGMLGTKVIALRILSILALARKNTATLVVPDKVIIIDLQDDNFIWGQVSSGSDELLYIEDLSDSVPDAPCQMGLKTLAAMRAIVDNNKPIKSADTTIDNPNRTAHVSRSDIHSSQTADARSGRDQYTDKERLRHLRMGHAVPLWAVKYYLKQSLLPHAVLSKLSLCSIFMQGPLPLSRIVEICSPNWSYTLCFKRESWYWVRWWPQILLTAVEEFSRITDLSARYGLRDKSLRVCWRSFVVSRNKPANLSLPSTLMVALSSPKPWTIWTKMESTWQLQRRTLPSQMVWPKGHMPCTQVWSDHILGGPSCFRDSVITHSDTFLALKMRIFTQRQRRFCISPHFIIHSHTWGICDSLVDEHFTAQMVPKCPILFSCS